MLGGKILLKTKTRVPGSFRQEAWQDTWEESYDLDFDGELNAETSIAIIRAFNDRQRRFQSGPRVPALRWSEPDRAVRVDVEKRQLIVHCAVNLCD